MNITFFQRSPKAGFSIHRVFSPIINNLENENISKFDVPCHRALPLSILRNIFFVFKHRNKHGINHITGDIHYCMIALYGCKTVLTIHDLSAMDSKTNPITKSLAKFLWFTIPLSIADKVVCISNHTKNDLMKITKRTDIEVIYNAVDPIFKTNNKNFNIFKPCILQIGTAWNKNILNIIEAVSSITCHLRIIGLCDISILNKLKLYNISFSIGINLTDYEILDEYKKCDIVSFCSIYEGFGMPIIEGNAIGRCVITSSIPPMNEIASNSACLINPNSIKSIRKGFSEIINNQDYRKQLIKNGRKNAERFQIFNTIKLYSEIYHSLI